MSSFVVTTVRLKRVAIFLTYRVFLPSAFISTDPSDDPEERLSVDKSARHVYGLIHARFILTTAGLERMLTKYLAGTFGVCPRVLCQETKLLPLGVSDIPRVDGVKLFCPHCEDVYCTKSARHGSVDGAYFGTTFAHMFLQTYPELVPVKSNKKYIPKIFGFKIADRNALAKQNTSQGDENNNNNSNSNALQE